MTDEAKRAYDWLESLASGNGFASYLIGAPEEARHAADLIESCPQNLNRLSGSGTL